MIHILQITSALARNGTETFIMNMLRTINRDKFHFDFLVATASDPNGYAEEAEALGATIYRVPFKRNRFFAYVRGYWRFFHQHAHEYDAVHLSACSLTQVLPLLLAKWYGIPVRVIHAHSTHTHGLHNQALHWLKRQFIGRIATHFLACSDVAAQYFFKPRELRKCIVLKNGVQTAVFAYNPQKREAMRRQLGLADKFVIGNVSRLTIVKNHTFLLDIFAAFATRHPEAMLMLVGTGELRDELQAKAERLGIADKVLFMGLRSDVPDLLQAMDYIVFPSLYEGLPFALVEAQTAGLPIVASDTISQQVDLTGNVRFLSLSDSPQIWSDAIDTHFLRRDTCEAIVTAGYSAEDTAQKLEAIYTNQPSR